MNCLIDHLVEGKMEVTGRRHKRSKQLLDDHDPLNVELNPICHLLIVLGAHHILLISGLRVNERRRYWKLKWEELDTTC